MESSSTAQNSSFSSSSECELLGIIYSEFDNEVGPRLVFQYPSNIMTPKIFETLSDYIIVGKHLCEKIMIIRYENQQIVNYSVAIENSKYGRNTLSFALGFILQETVDTEPYEIVLRKISNTLIALELESEFLFCATSKATLEDAMKVIFHGLTSIGEAYVRFDKANLLTIKLYRQLTNPPPLIHDYDVPILLLDKVTLSNISWDITAHKILPHINGRSCARKIAVDAEVTLTDSLSHMELAGGFVMHEEMSQNSSFLSVSSTFFRKSFLAGVF